MSGGFQTPITIKTAIDNIQHNHYLLPAIQRKFVWSSWQIETLFDSILRGYPINSFMFWKVSDKSIKNSYKFYRFLTDYREFFHEDNEDISTRGVPDFYAVIDGQQRLTSLYIGLRGSYAYKLPRKWWRDNEECIPTRKLYLNLSQPTSQQYDTQKIFDFRFLTQDEVSGKVSGEWFEVGRILEWDDAAKLMQGINSLALTNSNYAMETLPKLYEAIHINPVINYYLQEEQDSDKVLEIFIRTNSGGTSLSFSDLLMSIASANWEKIDARKEFDDLVHEIYTIGRPGFIINKDFILKTCLVLFVNDIRFQLKNFTYDNVRIFEDNWHDVRSAIISAFTLLDQLGFSDVTLRAKNAVIPLIYHIYYNGLAHDIVKSAYKPEEKKNIARWFIMTFIKSIFSGHSDVVLVTMRNVLHNTQSQDFPVQALIDAFRNNPAKNYSFDDDFIDGLLEAQKDSNEAFYVLHLLYSGLDYSNKFHQDHLHPASIFRDKAKMQQCIPPSDWEFASKPENWNGAANLQLLGGPQNSSKNDSPLEKWAAKHNISNRELFVPDSMSLKIADFRSFIEERKKNLHERIKEILQN